MLNQRLSGEICLLCPVQDPRQASHGILTFELRSVFVHNHTAEQCSCSTFRIDGGLLFDRKTRTWEEDWRGGEKEERWGKEMGKQDVGEDLR